MAKVQIGRLADTLVKAGVVKDRTAFVALCHSDWQAAQNLMLGVLKAREPRAAAPAPAYPSVLAAGNWRPEGVRVDQAKDPWSVKIAGEAAHPQRVTAATLAVQQRQVEAANAAAAQRHSSSFYDKSAGIAASGDNARRLAAARATDEARIRREQAARGL